MGFCGRSGAMADSEETGGTGQFTHLVVVGSSAGGIGALSEVVSNLPEDFPAPIVIAQHLDPGHKSHLKEILARNTKLPVRTVIFRVEVVAPTIDGEKPHFEIHACPLGEGQPDGGVLSIRSLRSGF
jgi:hypothetical protein